MLTAEDINTLMFQAINGSPLKASINGKVYKSWRPANSTREDVVVNVVVSDAELIQSAVCNVNIHLPSINAGDGPMPNSARFTALGNTAKPILENGHAKYFTYYTEQTALIKEQNREEWFLNFRIRFHFHNTIN